jgi:hypothetical protein
MRLPGMLPPHHRPRMQPQTHRQHPTVGDITNLHLQPLHKNCTTMKQISLADAQELACSDTGRLNDEIRYCQADWSVANARYIGDIEAKRCDKTFYGSWKGGWKKQMRLDARTRANKELLNEFLRENCTTIDGAIWLNNPTIIASL